MLSGKKLRFLFLRGRVVVPTNTERRMGVALISLNSVVV